MATGPDAGPMSSGRDFSLWRNMRAKCVTFRNFYVTHRQADSADTIALPRHLQLPTAHMPSLLINRRFPAPAFTMLHASLWRAAMRRSACLAGIGVLSACTAVSSVDPRPDGHLTVMSRARWSLISWNHVRSVGMKHAAAYCKDQGRQLHVVAVHTQGVWGVTDQMIEVVFDCY
jgi:hypothetical protein